MCVKKIKIAFSSEKNAYVHVGASASIRLVILCKSTSSERTCRIIASGASSNGFGFGERPPTIHIFARSDHAFFGLIISLIACESRSRARLCAPYMYIYAD